MNSPNFNLLMSYFTSMLSISVKPRENQIFSKMGKIVISVKIQNFSRSRMAKETFPLKLSHEIKQPRRISLDSEVVGISRFSRRGMSDDTW